MKRNIALGLAVAMAFVVSAGAVQSRRTPNANDGQPIRDALYGGSDAKIQSSTSAQMICSGKCLLLGVTRGTAALTTGLLLRDTTTADDRFVENLLPLIPFYPNESSYFANPIAFPVVFPNGISADMTGTGVATIHYLDLDE